MTRNFCTGTQASTEDRTKKNQLDKKLAAYALAGAAALVPGVAHAGPLDVTSFTVNTQVNQGGSYTFTLPGTNGLVISANHNVNNNGTPGDPTDDTFTNDVFATVSGGTQLVHDAAAFPFDNVTALAFGDLITPNSGTGWGGSGKLVQYNSSSSSNSGDFPGLQSDGPKYLGFYYADLDGNHAGWAEIATEATSATSSFYLYSYAYANTAGLNLRAGALQAEPAADAPEPSTMALLALGGAGLLAVRRRRSLNG